MNAVTANSAVDEAGQLRTAIGVWHLDRRADTELPHRQVDCKHTDRRVVRPGSTRAERRDFSQSEQQLAQPVWGFPVKPRRLARDL